MRFLVIAYSAFGFCATALLLSFLGKRWDNKQRRISYINELDEVVAFAELKQTFYSRFIAPGVKKLSKIFANLIPKNKRKSSKKNNSAVVERQLRLAGIYITAQEFGFIKTTVRVLTTIVFLLAAFVSELDATLKLLIVVMGIFLGFSAPILFLRSRVRGHQEKIREQLPDAMDMIGVCIEAGLSFDGALLKVSEKLSGAFIDELMIVYREIQMGRTRREALRSLSESTDIQELKTFAAALAQAEQLGIPINNVMRIQSEQLRVARKERAHEKGLKAPVKMMFPMVGLIFPVLLIVLMGPTIITVIDTF